jgi:hypothetical protein
MELIAVATSANKIATGIAVPRWEKLSYTALVRAVGLEPTQALRPNGFSYPFGFRRRPGWAFVVWTIPSPWRSALGAARLVSTPSRFRAWLGITSEGFPEFGQFYSCDFSRGTQIT